MQTPSQRCSTQGPITTRGTRRARHRCTSRPIGAGRRPSQHSSTQEPIQTRGPRMASPRCTKRPGMAGRRPSQHSSPQGPIQARGTRGLAPRCTRGPERPDGRHRSAARRRGRSKRARRVGPDPLRSDPRGLPGCRNIGLPAFEGRPDRLTPSAALCGPLRAFQGVAVYRPRLLPSAALYGPLRASQGHFRVNPTLPDAPTR